MVNRLFVEKKEKLAAEARALFSEAVGMLGIAGLTRVRVINRYDVEGVDGAHLMVWRQADLSAHERRGKPALLCNSVRNERKG